MTVGLDDLTDAQLADEAAPELGADQALLRVTRGGAPGRPDRADNLPDLDGVTDLHVNFRQVTVAC